MGKKICISLKSFILNENSNKSDLARQGPPLPMAESRASGKLDEVVDSAVCAPMPSSWHAWTYMAVISSAQAHTASFSFAVTKGAQARSAIQSGFVEWGSSTI